MARTKANKAHVLISGKIHYLKEISSLIGNGISIGKKGPSGGHGKFKNNRDWHFFNEYVNLESSKKLIGYYNRLKKYKGEDYASFIYFDLKIRPNSISFSVSKKIRDSIVHMIDESIKVIDSEKDKDKLLTFKASLLK